MVDVSKIKLFAVLCRYNSLKYSSPKFVKNLTIRQSKADRIGRFLVETKARFYTCHCTGIEPYKRLKTIIKDNIDYLSTGSEIII